MKTNPTKKYMPTRTGTTSLLILGVLLMGCDKDPQQHTDKALVGQVSSPAPSEEKPDQDWSQPYWVMPIGDALIKIPKGYLIRRDYGDGNSKGLNEHMKLQVSIVLTPKGKPRFLTIEEAGEAGPFDTYNKMYIDVGKVKIAFKDAILFDEQRLLENYFRAEQPAPAVVLDDLGLKVYRLYGGGKETEAMVIRALYFPLDTNFKMPNGSTFYLHCDGTPINPKAVKHCTTNFMSRRDRVAVGYSFPPQYLRHWKEIHQFVLNTLQFTN